MKKIFILLAGAFISTAGIHAQSVAINTDGSSPDPTAVLDVSSANKGVLLPRLSFAQRGLITTPATGLVIYQKDNNPGFYFYNGTSWTYMGGDNFGNHTAAANLKLNNFRLSNVDTTVGLSMNNRGAVTLRGKAVSAIPADTAAKDNFILGNDGSFLARGKYLTGPLPATGAGMRMMWFPGRGAFRLGNAVGGEWDSLKIDDYSVAMGNQVTASGYGSFAMGDQVTVSSTVGVGFGSAVQVTGTAAFSAGANNKAKGFCSVVLGYTDSASGQGSVAIGYRMAADQDYSVAIGYRGRAIHEGSLVLSDASSLSATLSSYTTSSAANQMTARYAGGYRFFTNDDMNIGVSLTANDNSWNIISDSTKKEKFAYADNEQFLNKLSRLKLGSWKYKAQKDNRRHYGPMAQEIFAAYGNDHLGKIGCDTSLGTGDMDGIMMIMLQGLEKRTTTQKQENALLTTRLSEMTTQLSDLKKENTDLKEQLAIVKTMQQQILALQQQVKDNNLAAAAEAVTPDKSTASSNK